MKYLRLMAVMSLFSMGAAHADWSAWREYTTITQGNRPFITIEFRTYQSKNWYPRVQWRAISHTNATLHCASIGNRRYFLSNQESVDRGPEGCRKVEPGETETYMSDTIGDDGLSVTEVTMANYRFKLEKGGETFDVDLSSGRFELPVASGQDDKATAGVTKPQSPRASRQADPQSSPQTAGSGAQQDASPVGSWDVYYLVSGQRQSRTKLTLNQNGEASYYAHDSAASYPARWTTNGGQLEMKVYGTRTHYNRDDPALILYLDINGNEVSGTHKDVIVNSTMKLAGRKL